MWFHLSRPEILYSFSEKKHCLFIKNLTTPMLVHIWIICSLLKEFELSLTKRIIQRRSRHRSYSHNLYIILLRYITTSRIYGVHTDSWALLKAVGLCLIEWTFEKKDTIVRNEETQYLKEISNVLKMLCMRIIFKSG